MGAGASAGISESIKAATQDEVNEALKGLSADSMDKLRKALVEAPAKLGWVEEFVICGQFSCKDIPTFVEATLVDFAIQVKEEPRAPRAAAFGVPPGDDMKDQVFWLAEFECMEAWSGPEHKERETNKEWAKIYMSVGASGNMMEDMAGSYTGNVWHLEKPGATTGDVYAVFVRAKAKDAAAADKLVDLIKAHGPVQMEAEEGALRYTLMRTANMAGPLPKDDVTVQWIEVFRNAEDYAKHKEAAHLKETMSKMKELLGDEAPITWEFANGKHFAK